MVSSKLMASSSSRNSDLKRKQLSPPTSIDFLRVERSSSTANDNLVSDTLTDDGFLRSGSAEQTLNSYKDHRGVFGTVAESSNTLLNAEISLLDKVGTVLPISRCDSEPSRTIRITTDDVWREIIAGKMSQKQPKEEMMTLEDFLLKTGAVEEDAAGSSGAAAIVDVKEEGLTGSIDANENFGVGVGVEGLGRGKRSLSLLEPLDKAAEQRQRRMIKNRESAARSRERKQVYQLELESMAVRLEEENDRLSKEKAERTRKRLKQLMENVIPVSEKRRTPRSLRKVHSMPW